MDNVERGLDSDDPWDTTIGLIQLARSTGWNLHFSMLALRQFIRLFFAALIQWAILRYFGYSLMTMQPYGGQPWLCNMGEDFMDCSETDPGPNCIGPGGQPYTKASLFSDFGTWSSRMFLRDSLAAIYADDPLGAPMTDKIYDKGNIDPGEYGLEDSTIRYLALLLFAIQIQAELRSIIDSLVVISWCPCTNDPWLSADSDAKTNDEVHFVHGGIPWYWKIFSYFIILFKLAVAMFTGVLGTRFLLDTAAIQDLIFNSLALTFIFTLDDLIQSAWSTKEPQRMMEKLEPIKTDREHWFTMMKDCCHEYLPIPVESILAILLVICWVYFIFWGHCVEGKNGGLVSGEVHAVEYGHYFILPWFWEYTTIPQWCPPVELLANPSLANCTR
jgi:hypothetical protein